MPLRRLLTPVWVILAAGAVYVLIELWKFAFVAFYIGSFGIYWLFYLADFAFLPLLAISLLAIVVFFVLGIAFVWSDKIAGFRYLAIGSASLVTGLGVVATFPLFFAWHTVHLDGLTAKGHTYHLAGYYMFDTDYGVYEYDPLGLVCKSIFLSPDNLNTDAMTAHFNYDSQTDTLTVVTDDVGTEAPIFTWAVP